MRSMLDMDTIQIEITNACRNSCSNCTRFCGLIKKPFFMEFDYFKRAVDSMVGYPKMTGIQGGEPLLHPDFEKMCEYLSSKIPYERLGLWTTLPEGFEHYREIIVKTFKHIFINDHSRPDIFHAPVLVAAEEVVKDINLMWNVIDKCWVQMSWSASINPKGAFFCEIAASMAILFEEFDSYRYGAWVVQPKWWYKTPKDFRYQIEHYCPRCGMCLLLAVRSSKEEIVDISPGNYNLLKDKVNEKYLRIHNLETVLNNSPMAKYKDFNYRNTIAKRYGMFLTINDQNFWTPWLYKEFKK